MSVRRMLPYILLNIVVSAVTVLAVLYWWETRQTDSMVEGEAATAVTATVPSVAGQSVAASAETAGEQATTPEPGDDPLVHVVQSGDTLGSLSRFYDVSMDDIMAANGLSNPNFLSVGQELVIPVGGLPTATPEPTATPTAVVTPSPVPTEPLTEGEANVEIVDVIGTGELTEEAVQIVNSGSRQVALLNWKLADEDGHVYTFEQVTLFGDGAGIVLHTEAGPNGPTDLYWGLEVPVWETGERVTLLDGDGSIQATFTVP